MAFNFVPAVRRNTHILVALAGASGSGKTYSALELATGLAKDGKIAVIDTEAGRALHYADRFTFDHCDLGPPFTPQRYREAIEAAEAAGYAVIVVDSMSHEHAGEGGLLEMAEAELNKPNMKSPANWAAPKAAHKRMMNRLLQCRSHLIFCLRAEEKIKIERIEDPATGRVRTAVVPMGWAPICEKTFMFEMVVSFVLSPEHPGVPVEGSGKIQDQHRSAFPVGQRVSRAAGEALAAWANGGVDVPTPVANGHSPEPPPIGLMGAGEQAAKQGTAYLEHWWLRELTTADRVALGARRGNSGENIARWKEIAVKADEAAAGEPAQSPEAGKPPLSPSPPPPGELSGPFNLPETRSLEQIFSDNVFAQVAKCRTLDEVEAVEEQWKPQIDDPAKLSRPAWLALSERIGSFKKDLQTAAANG